MKKLLCPITGVYVPRFALCTFLGFIFIFIYDFILHSQILMSIYEQTPHLWRTAEEMERFFPVMLLTQFLTAFITALIYTRNHEGKGIGEGIRFGILLGLLMGVFMAASYAWMPISSILAAAWFVGGFLQGLGLGVIYSLTYRPEKTK